MILDAVAHGILLPKGHGRLIDVSKLEYLKALNDAIHKKITWSEAITEIKDSAPTIVESDRESEEIETVEAIPKDQYEARLKADIRAILDKIRVEIEQFANIPCSRDDINIYDVFQIIDKYKTESEDNE